MNDFLNDKQEIEPAQEEVLQPIPDESIEVPVAQAEIQEAQGATDENVFEQDEMQQSTDVEGSALSKIDVNQPSTTPHNATLQEAPPVPVEHVISAPLSPTDIKQMLFSNKDTRLQDQRRRTSASSNPGSERKQSRYNAISFKRGLSLDQKYANAGRFFFAANKNNNENINTIPGIPTIGFPSWRSLGHRPLSMIPHVK